METPERKDPPKQSQQEAALGVIRDRSHAVRRALMSPDGRELYKMLKENFDPPSMKTPDPHSMSYLCGQRDVISWLSSMMSLTDDPTDISSFKEDETHVEAG